VHGKWRREEIFAAKNLALSSALCGCRFRVLVVKKNAK